MPSEAVIDLSDDSEDGSISGSLADAMSCIARQIETLAELTAMQVRKPELDYSDIPVRRRHVVDAFAALGKRMTDPSLSSIELRYAALLFDKAAGNSYGP